MKKYRINPAQEVTSDWSVKGFSVAKISEKVALCCPQYGTSSLDFMSALAEAGIWEYELLKEGEEYHGYVAIWKGFAVKIYYLDGSLTRYPADQIHRLLDLTDQANARNGNLFDGSKAGLKYIAPMCRPENCLGSKEIANAFRHAILNNDKIVTLDEAVKEKLVRSWYHTYRENLLEVE